METAINCWQITYPDGTVVVVVMPEPSVPPCIAPDGSTLEPCRSMHAVRAAQDLLNLGPDEAPRS